MQQTNLDRLTATLDEISDPNHANYGHFLTGLQVRGLSFARQALRSQKNPHPTPHTAKPNCNPPSALCLHQFHCRLLAVHSHFTATLKRLPPHH